MLQHAVHILATVRQGMKFLRLSFKPSLGNSYRDLFTADLPLCLKVGLS